MKELVIDGSFENINLSIFDSKELVYDLHLKSSSTHSRVLTSIFENAFKLLSVKLDDIEEVYCCIGPGKYTSLRVTLATIKGMLFKKIEHVYTITSLDLMASHITENDFRIVCKTSQTKTYFADYSIINNQVSRDGNIHCALQEIACNTDKKIVFENTIKTTRNIFKIEQKLIKRTDTYSLTPIY